MSLIGKDEMPVAVLIVLSFVLVVVLGQPDFVAWLDRWQTLISGVLATIAAGITIRILWLQLKQSDQREERQMAREHQAKRFLLVFTLSEIISYCVELLRELDQATALRRGTSLAGNWSPPVFQIEAIRTLSEFLETSESEAVNELVAFLITQLQVLDARIQSLLDDTDRYRFGMDDNIAVYQLQAGKIHQVAGHLLSYARGEDHLTSELPREELVRYMRFNEFGSSNDALAGWLNRWLARGENWQPRDDD